MRINRFITLTLIVLAFTLSGCAEYRALVGAYGAEGVDAALEVAEYGVCKVPSVGALERKYHLYSNPQDPRAKGWSGFCFPNAATVE